MLVVGATAPDRDAGKGRSTQKEPAADPKDPCVTGKDPNADGREPRAGLSSPKRQWKRATFR